MSLNLLLETPDVVAPWGIGEPAVYLAITGLALVIAVASVRQMLAPMVALVQALATVVVFVFLLAVLFLVVVAATVDLLPIVE